MCEGKVAPLHRACCGRLKCCFSALMHSVAARACALLRCGCVRVTACVTEAIVLNGRVKGDRVSCGPCGCIVVAVQPLSRDSWLLTARWGGELQPSLRTHCMRRRRPSTDKSGHFFIYCC